MPFSLLLLSFFHSSFLSTLVNNIHAFICNPSGQISLISSPLCQNFLSQLNKTENKAQIQIKTIHVSWHECLIKWLQHVSGNISGIIVVSFSYFYKAKMDNNMFQNKMLSMDKRDGSAVKNAYYSFRGLELESQHLLDTFRVSNNSLWPSWVLHSHGPPPHIIYT